MAKQNQNPKTSWWQQFVKDKSWYEPLRRNFWNNTNRLRAVKATFAIALLVVPFVILGKPFIAVSLGLGALAGALSETDDHPKGRIKSLALKVFSFGLASLSVSILLPYPVLFGLGLALSTIVFIVIGGLGERYRGVTFGALLVGIYAMLGADISPAWYWQPILLPGGALFYGILSLALLYYRPWRLLEEQLARGYMELSKYLDQKAGLFPSDERMQRKIRNQLALQNVQLVGALDRCKEVLNSYGDALKDDEPLKPYLRYFMLLQSLHERASSSHERYDLLSSDPANRELLEGIGQSLHLLSRVTKRVAESLLTGTPYRHSVSLEWVVKALQEKFDKQGLGDTHPLALLINNLSRSIVSLKNLTDDQQRTMAPRLAKDTRTLAQRLKEQLNWNHPRMRHAIRLALCFLISYAISEGFG
ncbi:MAG TPA: YccS/YhfK family membrane protein, partial [Sunxiuqinia sp.]|nr:YccS/YhfK family membrane protein [Sunxiuqinia sp.]